MRIFNGLFSIIFAVLVMALALIYPVASAVDHQVLSETFFTERMEAAGTYDAVYDAMMDEVEKQVTAAVQQDPNLDEEIAVWVNESLKTVLTRAYVVDLLKQNLSGTAAYLSGEADALPTFDLTPKYEELRTAMADGLTLERLTTILGLEINGAGKAILVLLGITDAEGNINSDLKEQAMRAVFDTNEALKAPFMMTSVTDVMVYTGNAEAEKDLAEARKWVTLFHRGVMPALMALSFFTTLLLLMHLKRISVAFRLNGWAYTLGALAALLSGAALSMPDIRFLDPVRALYAEKLTGLTGAFSLETLLVPVGNEIAKKGLIFLGVGIAFFLLAGLFSKRQKAARKNVLSDEYQA